MMRTGLNLFCWRTSSSSEVIWTSPAALPLVEERVGWVFVAAPAFAPVPVGALSSMSSFGSSFFSGASAVSAVWRAGSLAFAIFAFLEPLDLLLAPPPLGAVAPGLSGCAPRPGMYFLVAWTTVAVSPWLLVSLSFSFSLSLPKAFVLLLLLPVAVVVVFDVAVGPAGVASGVAEAEAEAEAEGGAWGAPAAATGFVWEVGGVAVSEAIARGVGV